MALTIEWTKEAEYTFDYIISYLEAYWSEQEVTQFVQRTEKVLKTDFGESPSLSQV